MTMASFAKLEFSVQMTCGSCEKKISNALQNVEGIRSVQASFQDERVLVDTSLTSSQVQKLIEATGRRAVLVGAGAGQGLVQRGLSAAVAMLSSNCDHSTSSLGPQGVVRMIQTAPDVCVIEGTIDGLKPGNYKVQVHEAGDLSDGCQSCGDIWHHPFSQPARSEEKAGILGEVEAQPNGRAEFRFVNNKVQIPDIIGRSVILQEYFHQTRGDRSCCGIVARSSGLFENSKKICQCDGVTLWDERDVPIAGPGRSNAKKSEL